MLRINLCFDRVNDCDIKNNGIKFITCNIKLSRQRWSYCKTSFLGFFIHIMEFGTLLSLSKARYISKDIKSKIIS